LYNSDYMKIFECFNLFAFLPTITLKEVKLSQRFINVVHEFQRGSTKYLQTDSPFTLNEQKEENEDR